MSRSSAPLAALLAVVTLTLAGCGGDGGASASPSVDPTEAHLQDQLDVLPTVDDAQRTDRSFAGGTLTESFSLPAGTPACLQLLARLDAGGYEVVAGVDRAAVVPTTCRTAAGDAATDTSAGSATILARGGSEIALTWTATSYTLSLSTA